MNRNAFSLFLVFLALSLFSCSDYQKLKKSSDNDLKYTRALEYYEKGDYFRAQQLFDQILIFFKGTEKAERISYLNAYCYFKQKDYIMGGYYFKAFTTSYPNSPLAEECAYMSAYCNYLDSPRSSLDQSNTMDAIQSLQLFVNQYPQSKKVEECNKLIDELYSKLEKKATDIALLYYRMSDYKAAITSFNNVLKDFPSTANKEQVLFYLLQAKYDYANKSIEAKQVERMQDARETTRAILTEFPSGKFTAQVLAIQKNIDKSINH